MAASSLLRCGACACLSDTRAKGWTGFLTEGVAGWETGVALFCPSCTNAYFDWLPRSPRLFERRGEEPVDQTEEHG